LSILGIPSSFIGRPATARSLMMLSERGTSAPMHRSTSLAPGAGRLRCRLGRRRRRQRPRRRL
jgi:hypothetical protein